MEEAIAEAAYRDAVSSMRGGDFPAARRTLEALIDAWNGDDPGVSPALAGHVHCTYACALRDSDRTEEALEWFGITAHQFSRHAGEAHVAAATAELLQADLLERVGRAGEARELLDTATMRLMMADDPALRRIFDAGMVALKRLEAAGS